MSYVKVKLCRIYYFKAGKSVTVQSMERQYANTSDLMAGRQPRDQAYNPVQMLASWAEIGNDYETKIRNLCAARNFSGELAYCVFTSECLEGRTIDEVITGLLGASYPAGFYEF